MSDSQENLKNEVEAPVAETVVPDIVGDTKEIKEVNLEEFPEQLRDEYAIAIAPLEAKKAVLYALVTCPHCIRTQRFLKNNNVDYTVIHADLFAGDARSNIMITLKQYNSRGSFPTLVFPSGHVVTGYSESKLREAISNE